MHILCDTIAVGFGVCGQKGGQGITGVGVAVGVAVIVGVCG